MVRGVGGAGLASCSALRSPQPEEARQYHSSFVWEGEIDAVFGPKHPAQETIDQFLKFAEKQDSLHWCRDVEVLKAFCLACRQNILIISVMIADLRTRGIPFGMDPAYDTYIPKTDDFVVHMWQYTWAYLDKIKCDLRRIGEWDRLRGWGIRASLVGCPTGEARYALHA